ncbi:beta-scruin-like isoform X2 [Dermacentor albipictus]|uniref:beta-scruin-like isoform X2 n=1 Tax=Dermacentor albipictus TaxID=60249 RepID=UPI0031FCCD29
MPCSDVMTQKVATLEEDIATFRHSLRPARSSLRWCIGAHHEWQHRRRPSMKFRMLEEGTTSFSPANSCWCATPALESGSDVSGGGYSANARLDLPVMGNFRSRSNIVLRRSHSSLHACLRTLPQAAQIQAENSVLVVLGGINPEDPMREDMGSAMLRYLFDDDEWELCDFMPQARSYHTIAHVGNCIYVIGGFNLDALEYEGPAPSAYCFCLDIEKMMWKSCPSMSHARACHVCVAVGERIYVAGGKDNAGRITNTTEFFDVDAGRWVSVSNLPQPLMASAAVHFNSRIWVLGGITYSTAGRCKVTSTIFELDLQNGRWFRSVSLWTPLAYSLALTTTDSSGQRLWLWGGMDENGRSAGELRLWKPDRRVWKATCRLQRPLHAFCGAAIGDLMCVVGGAESRSQAASDANTLVDVAAREVYAACPLPYPLTGAGAIVLPPQQRPSSSQTTQQSDDESTDWNTYNLRTVYRRYRQRKKVKEDDEMTESQFPAVGVHETTRILDSTFDSARIRREEILREKSPVHGTKEERVAVELRDDSRQQRKELEKKREARCSEGRGRRHSYQMLASSVDPNLGLALVLENDNHTCSTPYSDTAVVIDSIRRCKTISSATAWGVLSFGGIDLNRPACHEIGRLALYFGALKNGWQMLDPMPEPRNYHTASLVGDEVFIVGGCDPSRTRCDEMVSSDSVFCFSTGHMSWSERAKLPQARAFHGAAVVDDQLYVVGGRDQSGSYLDTVVVYSPMLNAWSVLLNLPVALMGAAVVAYRGRIWVIGGVALDRSSAPADSTGGRPLDDVLIVDTRRRRCLKGPSLPFPCAFGAGAVSANQIWLCGGMTPAEKGKLRSTCNIYVLDDGAWVFYDVLSLNRHAFPAASYADAFVMVFGGVSTSYEGSVDECEVFCTGPSHGNLRLRSPPFPLAGHACVVLPPSGGAEPDVRDIWRRMFDAAKRT